MRTTAALGRFPLLPHLWVKRRNGGFPGAQQKREVPEHRPEQTTATGTPDPRSHGLGF